MKSTYSTVLDLNWTEAVQIVDGSGNLLLRVLQFDVLFEIVSLCHLPNDSYAV